MRLLGDKRGARRTAEECGLPVLPGASACDTLETARAFGMKVEPRVRTEIDLSTEVDFDPYRAGGMEALMEAWLPLRGWTGNFRGTSPNGLGGGLNYNSMAVALTDGFAVAGTDTGHPQGRARGHNR